MRYFLYPIALCYGLVLRIRHLLYDIGILRSVRFDAPIIGVGNLSFGGTGKTPHVEYLIKLLQNTYRPAVLSRGYKRSTKGYLLASPQSTVAEIGDEPLQIAQKFPDVPLAVDEQRVRGVQRLLDSELKPDVIILDDAFQHRKLRPGLEILLTDYYHLYSRDHLFPVGNLRDLQSIASRASVIIVTKTPHVFSPYIKQEILETLKPKPHQKLFFSFTKYGKMIPLSKGQDSLIPKNLVTILLVTGIADADPLKEYLRNKCIDLIHKQYPDHHNFTEQDIKAIVERYNQIIGTSKIILTTEKDTGRLKESPYFSLFENLPVFYLPIEVRFHKTEQVSFDDYIFNYVKKSRRNT